MSRKIIIKATQTPAPAMRKSPLYAEYRAKIDTLIKKYETGIARDWSKFGGSDMADVINGKSKFRTLDDMLANKIGKIRGEDVSTSSLNTQWGHLFEPVLTNYLAAFWGTEVSELPPSIPSQHPRVGYSADGGMVFVNPNTGAAMCLMLEFKNPFERIPDGKVPGDYEYQIKSGLSNVNLAEIFPACLFVDCIQRLCNVYDLSTPGAFNTLFHIQSSYIYQFGKKQKKNKEAYTSELDLGIIGLYADAADDQIFKNEMESIMQLFYSQDDYNHEGIHDLGCESTQVIKLVFAMTSKDRPKSRLLPYYPPSFMTYLREKSECGQEKNDNDYCVNEQIIKFKKFCEDNGHMPICIVPYKTMKVSTCIVYPDREDFIARHTPKIDAAASKLDEMLSKLTI